MSKYYNNIQNNLSSHNMHHLLFTHCIYNKDQKQQQHQQQQQTMLYLFLYMNNNNKKKIHSESRLTGDAEGKY